MNVDDTLVVLDTCVLMPLRLSDVLMDLRGERLFAAHWTAEIDKEYLRNMQGAFGFSETATLKRLGAMKKRCPEWEVSATATALALVPDKVDAKDRHVAAAALTLRQYADHDEENGIRYTVCGGTGRHRSQGRRFPRCGLRRATGSGGTGCPERHQGLDGPTIHTRRTSGRTGDARNQDARGCTRKEMESRSDEETRQKRPRTISRVARAPQRPRTSRSPAAAPHR